MISDAPLAGAQFHGNVIEFLLKVYDFGRLIGQAHMSLKLDQISIESH